MSLDEPYLLLGLLAVPLLLAAYLWQLRHRRPSAVRYSNIALVRAAAGPSRRWRRHVPIGIVLASLGVLAFASARPQVQTDVPVDNASVILALDVSGSMCATDVDPNRLTAAQAAVRTFIESQRDETKIGLVLFSGFAQLAVAPTTNHVDLFTTLDSVTTGRGTAIGAAILTSIDAISEIDPSVSPADREAAPAPDGSSLGPTPTPSRAPTAPTGGKPATAPEIVILLTDGANTRGVTPEAAAVQGAARGVRIYPIGFGTTHPTQMVCSPDQVGAFDGSPVPRGDVGGGGGQGGGNFLIVDEAALRSVAATSGGEYFAATDADQLSRALTDLPKHVTVQKQDVDLSAGFTLAAALLLLAGLGLSIRWSSLSG